MSQPPIILCSNDRLQTWIDKSHKTSLDTCKVGVACFIGYS